MADFVVVAEHVAGMNQTVGLRAAIRALADSYAERFATWIVTRAYEQTEVKIFAETVEVPQNEIIKKGIKKLGEHAHALSHEEYFALASHIANTLDRENAAEVFDTLAGLFDDLAPPTTTADGIYEQVPKPPTKISACFAGLLWATLGDISAEVRWEAAHAVLLVVRIGDEEVLSELASFADGSVESAAFHDARFPTFRLHSTLWLLFALERSASESNRHLLEPFVPWLITIIRGVPHAANQFMAQHVLRLLAKGFQSAPSGDRLDSLNRRLTPEWVELDWSEHHARSDPLADELEEATESAAASFFYDFKDYWASDLATVFGTTEDVVAHRAERAAEKLTGYEPGKRDPRHEAGVFKRYNTYADYRIWPQEEDFAFYSAIHSLQQVAGELALRYSTFKEPGAYYDAYLAWLHTYLPKRRDGRWLSDRRDSPPSPPPESRLRGHSEHAWKWSLTPQDFEAVVRSTPAWIMVDADVETSYNQFSEEVEVSSALVPNNLAKSFLIALQMSPLGRNALYFPTTDIENFSDGDLDGSFRLTPWLNHAAHPEAIDKYDDYGRNVVFPPPRPGPAIIDAFSLKPDHDYREWTEENVVVFQSRVWDNLIQVGREEKNGTKGRLLEVSAEFLAKCLTAVDMTLVIQVNIRRDVYVASYRRKEIDDFERLEWSSKVYLVDQQGRWTQY